MHRLVVTCSLVVAAIASFGCNRTHQEGTASAAIDSKKYYAVLLSNGSVYFGHLEGMGAPFPVLTDVFYVQSATNPETKAITSILVKRGKEWHRPDRMILNEKSIVFVEPVGADSKVAELIAESRK